VCASARSYAASASSQRPALCASRATSTNSSTDVSIPYASFMAALHCAELLAALRHDFAECAEQIRIQYRAGLLLHDLECTILSVRIAVIAHAGQLDGHISYAHDTCRDRDLLAPQPVRIP